ncbi:MAG: cell division protein FtsQ/DivIB [Alphaproteobacteria bacterium]
MRQLISTLGLWRGQEKSPRGKINRKAQRRRVAPRWRRPALHAAGFLLLIGGAGSGAYWAWSSGMVARLTDHLIVSATEASVRAGLSVDEILVEGRTETTRAQLLNAIGVRQNDPILTIDTEAIRSRLRALGWVADAVVQRRLPGTLYVSIKERTAMAIWQRNGQFVLVDPHGEVIGAEGLERYTHLKVIIGEAAPKHAPALLDMLTSAPHLMQRVRAGIWVGNRRWNLQLDDGIDIHLPESDPQAAWSRLVTLDRDSKILSRNISVVDLRIRDRLIVQQRDRGDST